MADEIGQLGQAACAITKAGQCFEGLGAQFVGVGTGAFESEQGDVSWFVCGLVLACRLPQCCGRRSAVENIVDYLKEQARTFREAIQVALLTRVKTIRTIIESGSCAW